MRVAFRASVPVTMTRRPVQYDYLWADQPTPPPPVAHEYTDPPEPPYKVWPPRTGSALHPGETPQQRRIRSARFMLNPDTVRVDEERSRFTYTRCTLAGTVEIRDDRVWTTHGYQDLTSVDAAGAVLLLRCALRNVYEVRHPEHQSIDGIPLHGLSISLREVSR